MTTPGAEITEDIFNKVAPVVGVAVAIVATKDMLDNLNEMLDEVDLTGGWGADIRDRVLEDLRDMVADVRKALNRVEHRLGEGA